MSTRICGVCCERKLRRGKVRHVMLVSGGRMTRVQACTRCYLLSVPVVCAPPTTVAPACSCCRAALAAICVGCFERLGGSLRQLLAANIKLAAAGRRVCGLGPEEGLRCELDPGHAGPHQGRDLGGVPWTSTVALEPERHA